MVTLLALGQHCECSSASDATMKDVGKINKWQTTTKHTCIWLSRCKLFVFIFITKFHVSLSKVKVSAYIDMQWHIINPFPWLVIHGTKVFMFGNCYNV